MSTTIYGQNLIRLHELSWLNPQGKPQIATGVVIQALSTLMDAKPSELLDTWALKNIIGKLASQKCDDATAYQAQLAAELSKISAQEGLGASPMRIKLTKQQDFQAPTFFETLQPGFFHGFRFICKRTGQPYIGRLYLVTGPRVILSAGARSVISAELIRRRNYEFTISEYINEISTVLAEPLANLTSATLSLHFNRRGGISVQILRSLEQQEYDPFVLPSITE